jgi:hypothetical protein
MQQVFLQWHSPPLLSSRSWVEPLQYAFFTALPCLARSRHLLLSPVSMGGHHVEPEGIFLPVFSSLDLVQE